MAIHMLLCFLFVCSTAGVASKSLPVDNPNYILDPLNSTSHGTILSPQRMVLKLDCPGCPTYDPLWDTDEMALVWDFTINGSSPQILLNDDIFYPPGNQRGFTPITAHVALPVPWTTTIESYIDAPNTYEKAGLGGVVQTFPVENEHGWNLTSIWFTTVSYGTTRRNQFDNHYSNISIVQIFLLQTPHEESKDLRRGTDGTEKMDWTLEWWQIMPMSMLFDMQNQTMPETMSLPPGLKNKLLGIEEPEREGVKPETSIGERCGFTSDCWGLAAVVILGFLIAIAAAAIGVCLAWPMVLAWSLISSPGDSTSKAKGNEEDGPLLDGEDREIE